jgi:hypothetical protein
VNVGATCHFSCFLLFLGFFIVERILHTPGIDCS